MAERMWSVGGDAVHHGSVRSLAWMRRVRSMRGNAFSSTCRRVAWALASG